MLKKLRKGGGNTNLDLKLRREMELYFMRAAVIGSSREAVSLGYFIRKQNWHCLRCSNL